LAFCWLWLFIIIAQIIVSIYLIAKGSLHEAENTLHDYQEASAFWNQTGRSEFSNLEIKVYSTGSPLKVAGPLESYNSETKADLEDFYGNPYFEIESYEPLFYEAEVKVAELLKTNSYKFDLSKKLNFSLNLTKETSSTINLPSIHVFKHLARKGITDKACSEIYKGYFDYNSKKCLINWVSAR